MTNNNRNTNDEINGLFIYHDPKKGCVYYDFVTKNGYVMSKSDYQSYSKFSLLKLLSIASIYLFVQFLAVELWLAAVIGIGLFIAIEIIFRKTFIYTLPVVENYKPIKKDRLYVSMAKNMGMGRLIITTLVAITASTLIVIYAKMESFEGLNLIVTYLMALVMFAMFVNGIIAMSVQLKNKQK